MSDRITIAYLYPAEMSIYGDRGNVLTLVRRLEWRGYDASVLPVRVGEPFDPMQADLIFGGGGQDRGQAAIADDLRSRGEALRAAATAGVVMLTICGTYQLFGQTFTTVGGAELAGIGIFAAHTVGTATRMTGNVVLDSRWGTLVGFENHSGATFLDADQPSLGRVVKGFGNDGQSGYDGAVRHNVFGTYLHGPVLPKCPQLADHLLDLAVSRRYPGAVLAPLDDQRELDAARVAVSRPQ